MFRDMLADFDRRLADAAKPLGVWPPLPAGLEGEPLALRFGRVADRVLAANPDATVDELAEALDALGRTLNLPTRVWRREADEALYAFLTMGDSIRLGGAA